MAASTTAKEPTAPPPPVIGKAGRYTVFLTPPTTPKPPQNPTSDSPKFTPHKESPKIARPVQPPPLQFDQKSTTNSSSAAFGFFWDALARVQDVHSSVDEYLADWFGLNQSKYQWALNDYYESNGTEKEGAKPKEMKSKV